MNKNRKPVTMDLKVYIIPLLLISGIFIVTGFFLFSGIRDHFHDRRREEALTLAKSYARSISKYTEAEEIIDGLLTEKIRMATESAALMESEFSSGKLKELALDMGVDELDYYDETGYLTYSNLEHLIGWVIYPGHPIDDFLKSGEKTLVEEIRQDVITGDYYKYGYYRMEDGRLIQVGLRANTVYAFLERFSVGNLLSDLMSSESALRIDLLDQNLSVLSSTESTAAGTLPDLEEARRSLESSQEYSFLHDTGKEQQFQVLVPILLEEESVKDMYALSIAYSMDETEAEIRSMSFFGFTALVLIYGSLLYSMISTFRKNGSLKKAAYYSALSGLPNKLHLEEYLRSDIQRGFEKSRAMILLRVVNINSINMNYGYAFGDRVLRGISNRLEEFRKKGSMLFHFTADQFIFYRNDLTGVGETVSFADELMQSLAKPLSIDGIDIYLNMKSGIVRVDPSYEDVVSILKDASVALEQSLREDVGMVLYDERMYRSIQREEVIVKELRRAIEEQDSSVLFMEFQPIVDTSTRKITGFEALARMSSPVYGRVSPVEFIEIAEKNLIMVEMGSHLIDQAFDFIRELNEKGYGSVSVAVNVSGLQLLQSGFHEDVAEKIRSFGIPPEQVELEFTESMLVDNLEMVNHKFRVLRKMGVQIALDDFGTGYSSFVRLHELLIDKLKIDKQFINKLENSKRDLIIGDIIKMTHRYGLKVVAEGIEVELQRKFLLEQGCDYLQGYLFSPAVPRDKALELLEKENL